MLRPEASNYSDNPKCFYSVLKTGLVALFKSCLHLNIRIVQLPLISCGTGTSKNDREGIEVKAFDLAVPAALSGVSSRIDLDNHPLCVIVFKPEYKTFCFYR
ncbi:MAG: hypothetical protein RSB82_04430 [Victivallaceae bacterium]